VNCVGATWRCFVFSSSMSSDTDACECSFHFNFFFIAWRAHLQANSYVYFRVRLVDANQALKIDIKVTSGNPDVYVSTTVDEPTLVKHTWQLATAASKLGQNQSLVISPNHPQFGSFYYIGVHGFKAAATFDISATQGSAEAFAAEQAGPVAGMKGHAAGQAVGHSGAGAAIDPNSKLCDNCMQYVPNGAYMMHTAQCARNNWRCPQCHKVMAKKLKDSHSHCPQCQQEVSPLDMEKHIALTHRHVTCECGQKMEPGLLSLHQTEECRLRPQNCKWCNLQISLAKMDAHEGPCGSRTVECTMPGCNQAVPRRRFDIHMAADHGINPCLDGQGNRRRADDPGFREVRGAAAAGRGFTPPPGT
jgi:hypothetical protein